MSNSLDFKMSNFQNKEVDNITAIDVNQESVSRSNTNIQHQVIINLPQQPGPLHLGNVYHLNIGQGQGKQQKTQYNGGSSLNKKITSNNVNRDDRPPKEEVRPLWSSKRVIVQEELPVIARNMGANWKEVGEKLGFNFAQLDHYEADTKTMVDAIQRMLFRWIQWKDTKATVQKLTAALFEHGEHNAVRVLIALYRD